MKGEEERFFQFAKSLSRGVQTELIREGRYVDYRFVSLVSNALSFILRDFYFKKLLGSRGRNSSRKGVLSRFLSNRFVFLVGLLVLNFLIFKLIGFLHRERRSNISVGFLGWDSEIRYRRVSDKLVLYFENVDKIYRGLKGVNRGLFFALRGNIFLLGLSKAMFNTYFKLTKLGFLSLIRYDMSVIVKSVLDALRYKRLLKRFANRNILWGAVDAYLSPPRILSFFLGFYSGLQLNKRYFPKVFIVTNEGNITIRGLVLALRERRVKVFALQHGVIHRHHFAYYRLPLEHRLPISGVADLTLLYGEYYKRVLSEMGYPAKRLFVAGSPRYDDYFGEKAKLIKNKIMERYGLNDGVLVLSIFTQPQGEKVLSYLEMFERGIELLSRRGFHRNLFVFLKPHPGEKNNVAFINSYKNFVEKLRGMGLKASFVEFGEHTSLEVLLVTDVAFSITSTVLIEALLLGVIPVSFERSEIDHIKYMRENGCLLTINNENELVEMISHCSEVKEKFREDCTNFAIQFLANPGKSTEVIVELIKENL